MYCSTGLSSRPSRLSSLTAGTRAETSEGGREALVLIGHHVDYGLEAIVYGDWKELPTSPVVEQLPLCPDECLETVVGKGRSGLAPLGANR